MVKQKRQAEFVRWFGPLLTALRQLGGSATPREAIDRTAALEKVVYDIDLPFFDQFD